MFVRAPFHFLSSTPTSFHVNIIIVVVVMAWAQGDKMMFGMRLESDNVGGRGVGLASYRGWAEVYPRRGTEN